MQGTTGIKNMQDAAATEELIKLRRDTIRGLKHARLDEGINGVILLLQEAGVWRSLATVAVAKFGRR